MDSLVPPSSEDIKAIPEYLLEKHRLRQESMPVNPINPNHPAASTARKWTPSVSVCESPPRAAKARANNALMQHGASAPPPWCQDVAAVAVTSVATDAGKKTDVAKNAAGLSSALAISTANLATAAGSLTEPACSVNSSNDSSNSEDSDMIGGGDSPPRFSQWGRL